MRDSMSFGIGIALVAGLVGCQGNGGSASPPATTPAAAKAETEPPNLPHTAKIMVKKMNGVCELHMVDPRRYPTGSNGHGDVVSWQMHYQAGCEPFHKIILTSFYLVTDDACVPDAPFASGCSGTIEVPEDGSSAVSCTMDTDKPDHDWEYSVCAYDEDGKLVSDRDPQLQTHPPGVGEPPGIPEPGTTPIPKVCPQTMSCPETYP